MTAGERIYLRLQLEVLLNRLKRNLDQVPLAELKSTYKRDYEELRETIRRMAAEYIRSAVCENVSGYYLQGETESLFQEINGVINETEMQRELSHVLFREPDMERVQSLTESMRRQVTQIAEEYRAHVGGTPDR